MIEQSSNFLKEGDIEWQEPAAGLKRQMLGYNSDVMMVKIHFKAGSVGDPHSHPHVQTTYVSQGVFEVMIDGEVDILRQGDGFFVSPNVAHGVTCVEDGVLVDVFAPMRKDFLRE